MAPGDTASVRRPVEVFLSSSVIHGDLVTQHRRLSDHFLLRSGDELFSLKNANVVDSVGSLLPFGERQHFVKMHEVLFIIDRDSGPLKPSTNLDHSRIAKESKKALLLVGAYWIRGNVHTMPGGEIQDLLIVKGPFMPVTEATLVEHDGFKPATLLINRNKIACMATAE